jgi:hypothetical protein
MAWELTGNAGTDPTVDFVGTTDIQPLVIKTDGTERLRVDTGGNLGIGTTTPGGRLKVVDGGTSLQFANESGSAVLRVENSAPASLAVVDLGNASSHWQLRIQGNDGDKFLNRLLALTGESLVESRRLVPFSKSLLRLKREHNELAQILDRIRESLSQEKFNEHAEVKLLKRGFNWCGVVRICPNDCLSWKNSIGVRPISHIASMTRLWPVE